MQYCSIMVTEIVEIICQIRDVLGYFTTYILFTASIFLLYGKWTFMSYYVIGYFASSLLNFLLKAIIRQPRPSEDASLFDINVKYGKRISFDKYGMPSGHAQSAFYSTIFIFCALFSNKNIYWIFAFYLLMSINCLLQRVRFHNHSVIQVIAGSIVGGLFGYAMFLISKSKLFGKLRYKDDDDAPH